MLISNKLITELFGGIDAEKFFKVYDNSSKLENNGSLTIADIYLNDSKITRLFVAIHR